MPAGPDTSATPPRPARAASRAPRRTASSASRPRSGGRAGAAGAAGGGAAAGGRGGRGGRLRRRGGPGPQPLGQRSRLGRGRDAELGGQHVAAAAVGRHGLGPLAGGGQAADQGAVAGLAQAVVAQPAPGPLDRGGQVTVGLGELGQAVERGDQAVAPGVLGLDRPLVGDLRQEGPRGELHRGLERGAVAGRQQALGLLGVDPARQVGGQAGAGAIGHQVVAAARGLQRPADAPEGAAQRGAGARVEHVRPEDPRQPRARLHAGAHEQVRQQGPGLDAGHVRDGPAVDLDGEPAEQSGAEHPGHLGPGTARSIGRRASRSRRNGPGIAGGPRSERGSRTRHRQDAPASLNSS